MRFLPFLLFASVTSKCTACVVDPLAPARLRAAADVQPLCAGYIDATLPPYNASGDGVADDSAALQSAADDAYTARMTLLLPGGRVFLMSRQLTLLQRYCFPPCGYRRDYGMQVVGGGVDGGVARPVLRLRDSAVVADNTFVAFVAVQTDNSTLGDEASQYQSRWRGVDIDMGINPGVSALSMSAAQLCSIEDSAISGASFFAGINGLPGSGGFSANLNVTGGDYGILQNQYRPNPSIVGLRLVGQARAGILVQQSRGPVVVTGFHIESPTVPDPGWRAVLLNDTGAPEKDNAFAGEDGYFVVHGGSGSGGGGVVIESGGCDVALRNVFFSPGPGNATLFAAPRFGVAVPRGGPSPIDPEWVLISRFAFTASGGSVWDSGFNASAGRPVTAFLAPPGLQRVGPPPEGLATGHSWGPDGVPTWPRGRGAGLLDVIAAFGATPAWVNATDDDGARIQAALDASCNESSPAFGAAVFLPHGEFGLYAPLQLHGCARLVGAGSHSAWLGSLPAAPADPTSCWDAGSKAASSLDAMLISSQPPGPSAGAAAGPSLPPLLSDFGLIARPLCPFLELRAGADTLIRDVCVAPTVPPPAPSSLEAAAPPAPAPAPPPTAPYVALSGAMSGRVFGLSLDLLFGGNNGTNPPPGPWHVLLLVNGTGGGGGTVHLYQLSTEHMAGPKAVLVERAQGVHVHAWKSESVLLEPRTGGPGDTQSLAWIVDAENFTVFGHSGNFRQFNTTVGVVDVTGATAGIELMAMTRTYWPTEPAVGTMWVRDLAGGVVLDGHHEVAFYRRA